MAFTNVEAAEIFLQDVLAAAGEANRSSIWQYYLEGDVQAIAAIPENGIDLTTVDDYCAILLQETAELHPHVKSSISDAYGTAESAAGLLGAGRDPPKLSTTAILAIVLLMLTTIKEANVKVSGIAAKISNEPVVGEMLSKIMERLIESDRVKALSDKVCQATTSPEVPPIPVPRIEN